MTDELRARGMTRDMLVLPPRVHKHGVRERQLAELLAELGVGYVAEMVLLVERTTTLTHSTLVEKLAALHRDKLPIELLPVFEAIIAREGSTRARAIWIAYTYKSRAAPRLDVLLGALQDRDHEVRRAAANLLSQFDLPAERALPILEPMVAPHLMSTDVPSSDAFPSLLGAIAAVQPPPRHLAPALEQALLRVVESELVWLPQYFARALARIDPERALALLERLPDLEEKKHQRLAVALVESPHLPQRVRLAWVCRMLDAGFRGSIIAQATMLTDEMGAPHELVAPLCRVLASSTQPQVIAMLGRYDREPVLRELAPLITAPKATERRRALDVLFALADATSIARFLVDCDPVLVRRATRWLVVHGGAQLLPHIEGACT